MRHLSHYHKNITFRFANGATTLVQSVGAPCAGEILHIRQINSNASNAVTAALSINNEFNQEIWNGTARNRNASYDHEFTNRRILAGNDQVLCTISGDPGANGYEIEVIIDLYGRDA